MKKPQYIKASSIEEAIFLLGSTEGVSVPLAGGTDLLVRKRIEDPDYDRLVDVSRISEIQKVSNFENMLALGSGVTFSELIINKLIPNNLSVLIKACNSIGSPQIRNAGTLGGNVANAAACADSLPALVCFDTVIQLISLEKTRKVLVSDFVLGPHKTILERGELINLFFINLPPAHVKSHFIKVGRRNAQSISRLSIAASGGSNLNGIIDFIRICPGAATPKTIRFTSLESLLLGQKPGMDIFKEAGELAAKTMIEITGRRW